MDFPDLKTTIFSYLDKNDPNISSKMIQIESWVYVFLDLFNDIHVKKRLPFFIDVLTDEECWEENDTIHRVKLIRRNAARKMVQLQSWKGTTNPLDDFDRYQVACFCCLEDDIASLFDKFKRNHDVKDDDKNALKKLVKSLTRDQWYDPVLEYWSHIVGGCASELESSSKHLYEHGLKLALDRYIVYFEAVEFFWKKIKSLPEEEMSEKKKNDILMTTTIHATKTNIRRFPEVFEFCISQINPDKYAELLRRDFEENQEYNCLGALIDVLSFDQFRKVFDYLNPNDVSEALYYKWLTCLEIEVYPEYYADEAVKLFMDLWQKEGYDRHRAFVLNKELIDFDYRGTLIVPFIKKKYMEPVWAMFDRAYYGHVRAFLQSENIPYICSVLHKRGDQVSLNKLWSYKYVIRGFDNPSTSLRDAGLNEGPEIKRPRIE